MLIDHPSSSFEHIIFHRAGVPHWASLNVGVRAIPSSLHRSPLNGCFVGGRPVERNCRPSRHRYILYRPVSPIRTSKVNLENKSSPSGSSRPASPLPVGRHSGFVVSMHLTTSPIGGFIPLELFAALFVLYIALICCRGLHFSVENNLLPMFARRRERRRMRRERKIMERAPQVGDVTTELATAPGDASPYP